MIEALKNEDLLDKVGGRFRLSALIQKRWRELMMGARPMVEPGKMTAIEVIIREILEDKIVLKQTPPAGGDADA
jgi:DNA-directed RNA polymerase subunit omega